MAKSIEILKNESSGNITEKDIRVVLPNYIDCREIDLSKSEDKKWCDSTFARWIEIGLDSLRKIIPRWDRNINYYESRQTPPGYSSDALKRFIDANSGMIKPDEDNFIFFQDNKIKDVVDGNVGEYTAVKKQIIVKSDDNPRNNKIEFAYQKTIDRFERKTKAWQVVRRPAIRDMMLMGTGWTGHNYNPNKSQPYGEIQFKNISPRDMIIDVDSKAEFYNDRKYEIEIVEMELDRAKRFLFEEYGITDNISPDDDYSQNHANREEKDRDIQKTTFYIVEYRETYKTRYDLREKYNMIRNNAGINKDEFALNQEEEFYFIALYHRSLGTIFHQINPFKQYLKTPYCNKKSSRELLCLDDVWDLAVINDIINITKSIYLDNARMRNYVRVAIKDKLKETMGDQLETVIRFGGDIEIDGEDDVRKAIQFMQYPEVPKELLGFIEVAENVMKQQVQRYEPMRGEYPKGKYLAEDTFQGLVQENKKIFSYKDEAINYAGNEEGNLFYRIMAAKFKDEDFIDVIGVKKGEPEYIPINSIMTLQSFEDYLKESKTLDEQEAMMLSQIPETDPEFIQKKLSILKPAIERFSKENELEMVVKFTDNYGRPLNLIDIWKKRSMVFINQFCEDEKMDVKISMDFDSQKDEEMNRNIAKYLFEKIGEPMLGIFLEKMGGTWQDKKEEIIKLVEKYNEGKAMIAEIQNLGPEFIPALKNFMQQWSMAKAAAAGGGMQQQRQIQAA